MQKNMEFFIRVTKKFWNDRRDMDLDMDQRYGGQQEGCARPKETSLFSYVCYSGK